VDSRRPPLTFANAALTAGGTAALTYRLEIYEGDVLVATLTGAQADGGQTVATPAEDLKFDTAHRWRVRGELDGAFSPWSGSGEFLTPEPPRTAEAFTGGSRTISVGEALAIIIHVHDAERFDLGSRSSRESRIEFWKYAVGMVHYGHPIYNPLGGDRLWCIKDAGGGRPVSDDVIVRCDTGESWDTIGGAGVNGYTFHLDYIGRIGPPQNIYPPPPPPGLSAIAGRPSLPDRSSVVRDIHGMASRLIS
jgi:hypothetical protein